MAFGYYSPYTINAGQVPSPQSDFPILVSVTDARLKTVANGGHVQDAEGDDIRPYSDSALTTSITGYEKVFYDGVNGILEMHVKRSSVSDGLATYLAYGDASLSSDGSSTTTWSNSFLQVYHLKDGTTLSMVDSVGGAAATNGGATATTGQIDGGASFVAASSQKILLNQNINPTAITYSAWIKATTLPGAYNTVVEKGATSTNYFTLDVKSNGKLNIEVKATSARQYDGTGSHTLSTGTIYWVAATYDSSAGLIGYVNASSDGTVAANGNLASGVISTEIGHNAGFNCCFWNGMIDEVRFSSVARSADWITTEYNNQSAPATFATLGTEVAASVVKNRRSLGPRISSRQYYAD